MQPMLEGNHPLTRRKALVKLNALIDVCSFRIAYPHTSNRERLAWSRVLTGALTASSALLRDQDLDLLMRRVEELEKAAEQARR